MSMETEPFLDRPVVEVQVLYKAGTPQVVAGRANAKKNPAAGPVPGTVSCTSMLLSR
jgi:hypothetical protein